MSKSKVIGEADHIVRLLNKKTHVYLDEESGDFIGVAPAAFEKRESESSISLSWMEYFEVNGKKKKLEKIRGCLSNYFTFKPVHRFAILKADIVKLLEENGILVSLLHSPSIKNPAHCHIEGVLEDVYHEIGINILSMSVDETFTVIDLKKD